MKLKLFMIAKSDGAWSFHEFVFFQVQGVMYGIGPSSHYEVSPVKLVALESGQRLPIALRNHFNDGGIWGQSYG